jgi:hypothetical protein
MQDELAYFDARAKSEKVVIAKEKQGREDRIDMVYKSFYYYYFFKSLYSGNATELSRNHGTSE